MNPAKWSNVGPCDVCGRQATQIDLSGPAPRALCADHGYRVAVTPPTDDARPGDERMRADVPSGFVWPEGDDSPRDVRHAVLGVPVWALYGYTRAAGDPAVAAGDYGLPLADVEAAVAFATKYLAWFDPVAATDALDAANRERDEARAENAVLRDTWVDPEHARAVGEELTAEVNAHEATKRELAEWKARHFTTDHLRAAVELDVAAANRRADAAEAEAGRLREGIAGIDCPRCGNLGYGEHIQFATESSPEFRHRFPCPVCGSARAALARTEEAG